MANVETLTESQLIARIRAPFTTRHGDTRLGNGDDAAVLAAIPRLRCLTTDSLVQGTHFRLDPRWPARDVGHKALAVNLSDVAAMGAQAAHALLSLVLPPSLPLDWLDSFCAGFAELANAHQVELAGGNVARGEHVVASVTMVGEQLEGSVKTRAGARAGDVLLVSDSLGDAGAGLDLLLTETNTADEFSRALMQRQLRPRPRVELGAWLGAQEAVSALMDLSDGLAQDLPRMAATSGVAAVLELDRLPLTEAYLRWARERDVEPSTTATSLGEDYALLFSVHADEADSLIRRAQFDGHGALTIVGYCEPGTGVRARLRDRDIALPTSAFRHFG